MPKHACLDTSAFSSQVSDKISEKAGIKPSKCSKECGICFVVTENPDNVKQKASITIREGKNGVVVEALV